MKKTILFFALSLVANAVMAANPTITTEWELNPSFIGQSNNCRGMAFGTVGGNKVLALVSREGGNMVKILSTEDGFPITNLDVTSISGGVNAINDAAITTDGKILVSNLAIGTHIGNVFKVYQWNSVTAAPSVAISYTLPADASRYGDQITVTGSISAGTAKVYAASGAAVSGIAKVLVWSMSSNPGGTYAFNNTPTVLSTAITSTGTHASISFLPDGHFLFKANTTPIREFNADGSACAPSGEKVSGNAVLAAGNSVQHIKTIVDTTYVTYFKYGENANPLLGKADILKVVKGNLATGSVVGSTSSLSTNSNANGSGRVVVDDSGANIYLYVLSTNNGIGKYKVSFAGLTSLNYVNNDYIKVAVSPGIIYVSGVNASSIEIFSTFGQKIKSISNSNKIVIDNLKGVYIIQIKVDGQIVKNSKISLQ